MNEKLIKVELTEDEAKDAIIYLVKEYGEAAQMLYKKIHDAAKLFRAEQVKEK